MMKYKILFLFVFISCTPLSAQIGPDGTGTVDGYFIGPGVDLSGSPPVSLFSGYYHNMVLMEEGNCLAWGWNNYGQTNIDSDLKDIVS
ncbi:MAG: RCC1 domain-containing protein, partial [Verrucomicrobiales bacterium]|nr:RCC1 domain-containing protein [Verrucomicrobiales bacterium]